MAWTEYMSMGFKTTQIKPIVVLRYLALILAYVKILTCCRVIWSCVIILKILENELVNNSTGGPLIDYVKVTTTSILEFNAYLDNIA